MQEAATIYQRLRRWFSEDCLGLAREMRFSYLPPLLVYLAAGVSGFTGIIESFFVKEELGLSAAFLAGLGFWAGLPWALKMPLGHLVDIFWRQKAAFVYLGALLMALSLLIMVGLTGYKAEMVRLLPAGTWYVIATLLSPIGFVLQDVVADAMTVEAVPSHDLDGNPIPKERLVAMHVTMQTLGRIAIIGGIALVAGIGGWLATTLSYQVMYQAALVIPALSVAGVLAGQIHKGLRRRQMLERGLARARIDELLRDLPTKTSPNWYIILGSLVFVLTSLGLGLSSIALKKELVFLVSFAVVIFLMYVILGELPVEKRREIVAIATIIFVFRAMPNLGAGASWWQIDVLGFDEAFFGTLRQVAALLTIFGLIALRGWMIRKPIPYLIIFLSCYNTVMLLPYLGMYHGLHLFTQEYFGFGARTIAIIDTMADSPLGQVLMVPMLAWIAKEAPAHQKATYFAVMAAFTNLALSAASLATSYLNRIFIVERGSYDELGKIFIWVAIIGLTVPIATVLAIQWWQKTNPAK